MLRSHNKTIFETLGRNPVHPFPARMAAGIALEALGNTKKKLTVLDPMTGSGTVIAVARAKGHKAIGIDLDPLAVLLAGVWTRPVDRKGVETAAASVLAAAQRSFSTLRVAKAYPSGSDKKTKAFVRYWFDPHARRQLTCLARAIARVRNRKVRDVLWCGFSRLIITKSSGASLAMDLSHSRPHKEFTSAPVKPFGKFLSAVETVIKNCPAAGKRVGPKAKVLRGDARKLKMSAGSVDLVLTSPPYLNAIDYMRCSKFSLVWMGYNVDRLRDIRGESVGAEKASNAALESEWVKALLKTLRLNPKLSDRNQAVLAQYIWDMEKSLREASRVLKKKGRAVYVVGDSTLRGTFVRNSSVVTAVARRNGLALLSKHTRILPANRRYLPPPQMQRKAAQFDMRMRKEVVLVFDKVAA